MVVAPLTVHAVALIAQLQIHMKTRIYIRNKDTYKHKNSDINTDTVW